MIALRQMKFGKDPAIISDIQKMGKIFWKIQLQQRLYNHYQKESKTHGPVLVGAVI